MFNFTEGMLVIVSRTKACRPNEIIYNNGYPKIGWIGRLREVSHRETKEWAIDWRNNYIGENIDNDIVRGDLIREWMISPCISNYPDKQPLRLEDRVIYVSGVHGDSLSNPVFNGRMGQVYGRVRSVDRRNEKIKVQWIGRHNSPDYYPYSNKKIINEYKLKDLVPLSILESPPKRNIKKHIEQLCDHLYQFTGVDDSPHRSIYSLSPHPARFIRRTNTSSGSY